MKRLLIIWHSQTGGSKALAQAAAEGAAAFDAIEAKLLFADAAQPAQMLQSDAYLFVFPENLAAISGVMKAFFDRCYYPCLGKIEGRPYAIIVCAGSDGSNAARQAERIATGWRLKKVADPLIVCTNAQTEAAILGSKTISPDELRKAVDTGAHIAAGVALGIF
ncbi:flavodoxin family protein [Sphingorhabdus sp. IMCC26285]|uniref:Flavodoxin family protein n=1 Tax=Sphingorhabdus profundilacus TaxID=2509718 RepID=A0A6I4M3M7_9SPHN|nr:NAD(P)H-dependent oxidoreductase [Sphingorhabdus profundilacus]MVZ98500.1 flavodoxin family protein [Sphingorhabdus profundilacus]